MGRYSVKDIKHKFESQSRLGYGIAGKRGGNPQIKDDVGYVCTYVDSGSGCSSEGNSIEVSAFSGRGCSYKRREKCDITIRKNGNVIFNGDFEELISKLEEKC